MPKKGKDVASKGINVRSAPGGAPAEIVDIMLETSTSMSCACDVDKVKQEVRTVIDRMGPSTPHLIDTCTGSCMADNEASSHSNSTTVRTDCSRTMKDSTSEQATRADYSLPQDETDFSRAAQLNTTTQFTLETHEPPPAICPPPMYPANAAFGSECVCPQIASYLSKNVAATQPVKRKKNFVECVCKFFKRDKQDCKQREYYKMNVKRSESKQGIAKQLVFELVDDVKLCDCDRCQYIEEPPDVLGKNLKNLNNEILSRHDDCYIDNKPKLRNKLSDRILKCEDCKGVTKVDVYYFDHGNHSYLQTTDSPPKVTTDAFAEKTEIYTTRFWAEIFGTINIATSFCTSFILQLLRFLLYSVVRPLTIGIVQLLSDYFFKPLLTTLFNAIIQPVMNLLYNIFVLLRDLCKPVAEGVGYFLREIAVLVSAFRIVDVKSRKECFPKCDKV